MKHVFIINPVSGVTNAKVFLKPKIEAAAEKLGADYVIATTEYPGHATEIVNKYAKSGVPVRFYACGGDGTLNEVLLGALKYENAATACVPCGSGNDFVRNFGPREAFLNIEDQMLGKTVDIDIIQTQNGIASSICSAGLDARVGYDIPKFRRLPGMGGEMAYRLSILTALCSKLGHQLRVVADEEVFTGKYLMIAICNGVAYGGGFKASPEANMCDGLLELVMVKKISRLRIAGVVNTYKTGKHICQGRVIPELEDVVTYRKVKNVSIQVLDERPIVLNQDGECSLCNKMEAHVRPGATNIVLPASLCKRYQMAKFRINQ